MLTDFQDFYLLAHDSPIPVLTLQTAWCTGMGKERPAPSKQSFRKTTLGSSEDSIQTAIYTDNRAVGKGRERLQSPS